MAFKDPEKRREYLARWYAENKERVAEKTRKWSVENRERKAACTMIRNARSRAAKKGLPFDLDGRQDEIEGVITHGGCHYTRLPFNVEGSLTWDSPSLDRVEPELGYVWSNVRVALHCINMFKGSYPLEKICFVAEHLLDWQAAKTAGSVLLPYQLKETDSEDTP